MKVCSTCQNMYVMSLQPNGELIWKCLSCGIEEKQDGGCLLMETLVQERSSEGYRILLNEFTRQDPTLPHLHTMKCPRADCNSNVGTAEKDVIYIKYDPANLKYLYICDVCGEQWRSRT